MGLLFRPCRRKGAPIVIFKKDGDMVKRFTLAPKFKHGFAQGSRKNQPVCLLLEGGHYRHLRPPAEAIFPHNWLRENIAEDILELKGAGRSSCGSKTPSVHTIVSRISAVVDTPEADTQPEKPSGSRDLPARPALLVLGDQARLPKDPLTERWSLPDRGGFREGSSSSGTPSIHTLQGPAASEVVRVKPNGRPPSVKMPSATRFGPNKAKTAQAEVDAPDPAAAGCTPCKMPCFVGVGRQEMR